MQGAIFYLLTVLIWGSTWFAIKFQLGVVDPSVSLVYRFGLAALLLMALFAVVSGVPLSFEWTMAYVGSLLYLSIFGSIIAFGAYLTLVGRIGADRAAYATVLFPLVALVISSLFEGFHWTPMALSGIVLVLLGNVMVVSRGLGARWRRRVAVA